MKTRQFPTSGRAFRGVALGSLSVLAALCSAGACRQGDGAADAQNGDARDALTVVKAAELQMMFEEALRSPPELTARGFVVRSIRADEGVPTSGKRWVSLPGEVAVEVDGAGDVLHVTDHRNAVAVTARRLYDHPGSSAIEGPALVTRADSGAVRAALLSRPSGVEDLLYKTDARLETGYELDLPEGWSLRQPRGFPGLVEIRDGGGKPRARILARFAWDATGKRWPVTARVDARQVSFQVSEEAELPVAIDPEWQGTGTPAIVRSRATSTLLQDGRVIVIGGVAGADDAIAGGGEVLCTTEIYSPFDLTWEAGPALQGPSDAACTPLMEHVAVPLPDGTVLVTGGANRAQTLGANQPAAVSAAWRFDPRLGSFTPIGSMTEARVHHTATLIPSPNPSQDPDGWQVLIAGGQDRMTPLNESGSGCPVDTCQRCVGKPTAEIFDASGTFTKIDMDIARACHSATLLGDGRVLFVGGGTDLVSTVPGGYAEPVTQLSLFVPGTGFQTLTTALNSPRFGHVAVHRPAPDGGKVLIALGRDDVSLIAPPKAGAVEAEIIDLSTVLTSSPPAKAAPIVCDPATNCPTGRAYAAAVLTRDGTALIAGGQEKGSDQTQPSAEANVFDFDTEQFVENAPALLSPASKPVLTNLPTGNTLLVGLTAPAELFPDNEWQYLDIQSTMAEKRTWQTATLLPDGTVLIAGGLPDFAEAMGSSETYASTEIFDPEQLAVTAGPAMTMPRGGHTATYLPPGDGKPARVLITGGLPNFGAAALENGATNTAEILELGGSFTQTATPMHHARAYHSAVRLPNGKVLIVGDYDGVNVNPPSAELFDPATDEFIELPSPLQARVSSLISLLPNGQVLLAGGFTGATPTPIMYGDISSAEIFDTGLGTHGEFRATGSMVVPRGFGTATPLANGQILIAGGSPSSATAELFDPETEVFSLVAGAMSAPRMAHSATMLPNGKVLIGGGAGAQAGIDPREDSEVFDPSTQQFDVIPPAASGPRRQNHPALLLPNGSVALIGGTPDKLNREAINVISLIAPEGTPIASNPGILNGPDAVLPGDEYEIQGTALTMFWATSSGPYASPTGSPIAIWVPTGGPPTAGTFAPFTSGGATWTPPSSPFTGPGVLYASLSGQTGKPGVQVEVLKAPDGVSCSSDTACESGFCSDGVCCDDRCHVPGEEDRSCRACSVAMGAAVDGVCSFVAENTDPYDDCPKAPECAERFAVCGDDGACKPCRCESTLDCADGYTCSADGHCEEPPTVVVGGCSTAVGRDREPLLPSPFALLAAVMFLRRRRASVSLPPSRCRSVEQKAPQQGLTYRAKVCALLLAREPVDGDL